MFVYVCTSTFFLLFWMVASKRLSLRLKSPEESVRATPTSLLCVTGTVLLVGGILVGLGERGIRAKAFGNKGRLSDEFNVIAPAAAVCGLFNLVLASAIVGEFLK